MKFLDCTSESTTTISTTITATPTTSAYFSFYLFEKSVLIISNILDSFKRTKFYSSFSGQTTQMNQTNASVVTKPYYCSGVSSYTLWQLYSNTGMTMNISTSSCNFISTPFYFTSLAGVTQHWDLGGYSAIYGATKNSFTIYTYSLTGTNSTVSLNRTQTYQWNINWFGILK